MSWVGSNEGVAIKTTVGKLREALIAGAGNIHFAKVNYEPLAMVNINQHHVTTNKIITYASENEFRAVLFNQLDRKKLPKRVPLYEIAPPVQIDLAKLFGEIYLSPFTSQWFEKVVKSAVNLHLPSISIGNLVHSRIKDK